MTALSILWLALVAIALAVIGWLCTFRTRLVVAWAQKNYARSPLIRAWPFSNIVLKSWYPTYLRCAGVFVWLFDVAVVYLALTQDAR